MRDVFLDIPGMKTDQGLKGDSSHTFQSGSLTQDEKLPSHWEQGK
jgi:hypothetical protein